MNSTGWAFIASAIILLCIICVIFISDYFGEIYGLLTFIAELIIIGVFLIKFGDKV